MCDRVKSLAQPWWFLDQPLMAHCVLFPVENSTGVTEMASEGHTIIKVCKLWQHTGSLLNSRNKRKLFWGVVSLNLFQNKSMYPKLRFIYNFVHTNYSADLYIVKHLYIKNPPQNEMKINFESNIPAVNKWVSNTLLHTNLSILSLGLMVRLHLATELRALAKPENLSNSTLNST